MTLRSAPSACARAVSCSVKARFVAQGVDGCACLGQALNSEPTCLLQERTHRGGVGSVFEHRVGCLELDGQRTEGMREDVMDLASDPVALGQRSCAITFGVSAHSLAQQRLGLRGPVAVLAAAGPAEQRCNNREQALGDDRPRRAEEQHADDQGDRADTGDPEGRHGLEGHRRGEHRDRRKGDADRGERRDHAAGPGQHRQGDQREPA